MKAYKVFNHDWTCRDYQYEVGKSYHCDGKIELCSNGFHACEKASDCFNYYYFDSENHVAEVELSGTILTDNDGKSCASDITISKEIDWQTVLKIVNDGKNCTGLRNSGNCNSGNWNSGDRNSGFFNTKEPKLMIFNKFTNKKREDIYFPSFLYFDLTTWVS